MKKLLFLIPISIFIFSCSSDETSTPITPPAPIVKYTITLSAGEGGTVSTTGGEYESGQTVSVTATPQGEYLFKDWSDNNTDATRTITVNSNLTLTANFEKRKYPLTLNIQGEGEVLEEIVNAGRTTDYDSGTSVKLTAVPTEGWVFAGWTGEIESNNSKDNPLTVTVNKNISLTSNFSEVIPPSITSYLKSKMFTKGVKDTLMIKLNTPSGFSSVNVSSELGNISVYSSPEKGNIDGELVLEYTNQSVDNVLWDNTIAGYDPIEINIVDNNQNETKLIYNIRIQPEPIFYNINVDSRISMNYYPNRLHIQRIRYDNKIDNAYFDPCIMGDLIEREYNRWGHLRDGIDYPLFTDINGDGYFDIICFAAYQGDGGMETYQNEDGYLELYLYEDGKFVYSNLLEEHRYLGAFKIFPADFDNDGDVDLYIFNSGLDKDPFPGDRSVILENKMDDQKFVEHLVGKQHFTHGASIVDIDQDGDLDIFESGRGIESFSGFYINNGNFKFEEQSNFIVGSNIINSTFLTTEFKDIDNDGIIDKVGAYIEYSNCPEYLPENVESCPDFNPIIFWGGEDNSFSFKNISDIPKVENFGLPLSILFYDLDNDNRDEIIISRKEGNSFNDPNNYKGVYIQICKIDMNRVVTDVTNEFINDNIIRDKTCNIPFPQPVYLFDLDNNGLLDIYKRSILFGFEVRWEWNGSRFVKISP